MIGWLRGLFAPATEAVWVVPSTEYVSPPLSGGFTLFDDPEALDRAWKSVVALSQREVRNG